MNGSVVSTTTGNIIFDGQGGEGLSGAGIRFDSANTLVTSSYGDITLTGRGGNGTDNGSVGIDILSGATVTSTGTGAGAATITLHGTGSATGTSGNMGLRLRSPNMALATIDGDITLTGIGGQGSINGHFGIYIFDGFDITSSGDGNIAVSGIKGSGNSFGLSVRDAGSVIGGPSATGNITLNIDDYNFTSAPSFETTGTVTIQPYTIESVPKKL